MEDFEETLRLNLKPALDDLEEFKRNWEKNLEITEWDGHTFSPNFFADTAKYACEEWTPKHGDIFITSFPKTGTHWIDEIVKQILYTRDPTGLELAQKWNSELSIIEFGPASKFKILDILPLSRRLFFCHLPPYLMNLEKIKKCGAKIIYMYRNPKDQTVSWYHFARRIPHAKTKAFKDLYSDDWDKFIDNYFSGKMPTEQRQGQWYPDHIKSWYGHKNDDNVMFVCYEELSKDIKSEIRRVAGFLDVKITKDEVDSVAEKCSFEYMRDSACGTPLQDMVQLFRKGKVGNWKDYFTVAQSEAVDKMIEEKLKDTDITFTYEP